ncbi:response regulator [Desulfobacter latus]|uniref:Response regulator n=1 Tax=Desulfobacter latus TaxID=2292 RepID=A0A850TCM5_9BACT|nr:response regulator [Desulfobacter latus]NWH05146.1 response regulator [Desulfobacter latus]
MDILLADDSRLVRNTFKRYLKMLGYAPNVFEAENGAKTIEAWKAHAPDLMILDLIMPEPDGEAVLKTVRKTDESCFIAVLSSNFQAPVKIRIINNGANLFIEKPLSPEKVKEVMMAFKVFQKEHGLTE